MWKKTVRLIKWIIGNTLLVGALFYWLVFDNIYGANLSKFIIWIHILGPLLIFSAGKDATKDARKKFKEGNFPILEWLDLIFDVIIVIALATCGHFFYAPFYMLGTAFQREIKGSK